MVLYSEQGFDETTVAEIAGRAGLTKRTFFRYFADKREVLFWGAERLEELLVTAVDAAPAAASALDVIALALDTLAVRFEDQRATAALRLRIVAASPELRERQLIKLAALAEAVARALRARGVGDTAAILAAEAGISVMRVAYDQWIDGSNQDTLQHLAAESLAELREVAAPREPIGGNG
jgi:AcrR family transcriptional regulator